MKNLSFCLLLALLVVLPLEAKKNASIFLVGDETMADHLIENENTACGWGQVLPSFLAPGVRVENHAADSASTKSFYEDGHWETMMYRVRRGDILFIQLGLNDMNPDDSVHHSTLAQYENNLSTMVVGAKNRGLHVILFTPVSQCFFKDSIFYKRFGAYPEGVRRVAKRWDVPLVDLETITEGKWDGIGEKEARTMFVENSNILLNTKGAFTVCGLAVRAIQEMQIKFLDNLHPATEALYTQPWKKE